MFAKFSFLRTLRFSDVLTTVPVGTVFIYLIPNFQSLLQVPDEPSGHDEGLRIVGLHPLVHHRAVQHSGDEIVASSLKKKHQTIQ
jgi:hypothetical protein